jgi:D-galactarolactone cycloisomerase
MNRRTFLYSTGLALAATGFPRFARAAKVSRELQITRIVIQEARGRRLTPVAPNAYAAYRGYDVSEPILRLQTQQGMEGISRMSGSTEALRQLLGLDPFKVFEWRDDRIVGPAEAHRELLQKLAGVDIALLDLLGKALQRPSAELLGKPVRDTVLVYDSSLYMEDLLKPDQLSGLAYLDGAMPSDPVEWVALKAKWLLAQRPEKFKAVKIKIGRVRWMDSFEAALVRDIAVTHAVRAAVGRDVKIMVDGNKAYERRPSAAGDYAEAVRAAKVYFMEEMFPEVDIVATEALKRRLRAANDPVKLAGGESFGGGVPEKVYTHRFKSEQGDEPLIDVEQADMNAHGYLRLRAKAAAQAKLGMTMAPHNFGSKLGLFAQVHLGTVTPNWEICELDDSEFPALQSPGIAIANGEAKLTGHPGLGVILKEAALAKPSLELNA